MEAINVKTGIYRISHVNRHDCQYFHCNRSCRILRIKPTCQTGSDLKRLSYTCQSKRREPVGPGVFRKQRSTNRV